LIGEQTSTVDTTEPVTLFPGAFNPMHHGHQEMISYAEQLLGVQVHLEISIRNVDKPPIDFLAMQDRLEQLGDYPVIYSNSPTFIEKSRIFPQCCFIVGADTLLRIADKKYYGNDEQQLATAIDEMHELGCCMLVFGREINGQFHALSDLKLPIRVKQLCTGVDEDAFRYDISSSAVRQGP
jgi:nicotinic acid mononucleotide adenylyltransferase